MDRTEVLKELDDTIARLSQATQKLISLKMRSNTMSAEEIMQELLLALTFGAELEQNKPSIIV